ncbi:MlaD family protein [Halobacteriovorax sp. HLS]|uniref:MlaD family protein n=1 Tax=Halobacteriovorax sp. HLS TaxID=2234000 RepID=UPI000FDC3403|nr:MlaD family protein [Halobacteriovorax sp. HLS]
MNEFKIGLMAIATMGMVVYMSLKITSNQSGFGEYVTYRTIVNDASGIFPKTPIKVAGINAGRIKKIELQGNQALITFEVLNTIKIVKDSMLKIKTVGFLGDKYLEISIGLSQDLLSDNGFILSQEGAGVEKLVKDAGDVLEDVKVMMKSLRSSISPEGQVSPVKKMLDDLNVVAANARVATESLKNVLAGNEEKLNALIGNLERFSEQIAYHTDDQEQNSAMKDLKSILANADSMTADLKALVADVKEGKGTLGKFLVEEEIADEVKQTLSSVNKIVGRVDDIRTELSVFLGAGSEEGSSSGGALRIFPSPERFYILGLTSSDFGPENEKETIRTINGVTTTEVEKTTRKNVFRFDLQIGRKLHNWHVRGGIIESTGGVGVDYDFFNGATRVSFDAYDYRTNLGPNLRLATEVQLWNVFYGKVSGLDLATKNRAGMLSIGLRFNDEDIKGLVGFFL